MSNAQSYPLVEFKTNQALLATDPNRSQVVRVKSQSLLDAAVSQIRQDGNVLLTIDTLDEAIVMDIASGQYVLVGGSVVTLDGGQAIYRVSDPGSGGIEMDNGNELMILFQASTGTAAGYDVGADDGELPLAEDVVLQSQGRSINFMTYGGTANAITLTPIGNGSTSLVDGDIVNFRATAANTGAVTINGEATETVTGSVLPAGYIRDDAPTKLMWNAVTSKFRVYRETELLEFTNETYTLHENGKMYVERIVNLGSRIEDGTGSTSEPYRTGPIDWTFQIPFYSAPKFEGIGIIDSISAPPRLNSISAREVLLNSIADIQSGMLSSSSTDADVIGHLSAKGLWYNPTP